MNLAELINAVRAAQGVSLEQMAKRAQRAGFPKFGKSQLSRATTDPLRAFPTQNLPAFAAALQVDVLEVLCACAESVYGDKFRFTIGEDGRRVVVTPAVTESGEDTPDEGPSHVVYELKREEVSGETDDE